jgi:hypothetical protein
MEDCPYHMCIDNIFSEVRDRLSEYYNTPYLEYWLMGETGFEELYIEKVNEYAAAPLWGPNEARVEHKGRSLEVTIYLWKKKEPTLSFDAALKKLKTHIKTQFKSDEMRNIFDDCTCD